MQNRRKVVMCWIDKMLPDQIEFLNKISGDVKLTLEIDNSKENLNLLVDNTYYWDKTTLVVTPEEEENNLILTPLKKSYERVGLDFMTDLFLPNIKKLYELEAFVNTCFKFIDGRRNLTQEFVVNELHPEYLENRDKREYYIDSDFAVRTYYGNTVIDRNVVKDLMEKIITLWSETFSSRKSFLDNLFGNNEKEG